MRQTNEAGISLIKSFEKLRLKAYQDQGGVWTIGYGHTGPRVSEGMTITEEVAEMYLRADLMFAQSTVMAEVKVPLTDNQFAALVAFVFNIGAGHFAGNATRKPSNVLLSLNAKNYAEAAKGLREWNKQGGAVSQGLVNRRAAEEHLFRMP